MFVIRIKFRDEVWLLHAIPDFRCTDLQSALLFGEREKADKACTALTDKGWEAIVIEL